MNFTNSEGVACIGPPPNCRTACHWRDAVPINHADANAAKVGGLMIGPFGNGAEWVRIKSIYATQDKQGRAWITRYGCLFRWNGG